MTDYDDTERTFVLPRVYKWHCISDNRRILYIDDGYIEVRKARESGVWIINFYDLPIYRSIDKMDLADRRVVLGDLTGEYDSHDPAMDAAERVLLAVFVIRDRRDA